MSVTLFDELEEPKANGFKEFWALFPRDKMNKGRKSGKSKCLQLWKKNRLYQDDRRQKVMAALKEDKKEISKGAYAFCPGSDDRMKYFPGPAPWLNQGKWDRDIDIEEQARPSSGEEAPVFVPPTPEVRHVISDEMKRSMAPVWRLCAQGKASSIEQAKRMIEEGAKDAL